jgi:hypothetical protein
MAMETNKILDLENDGLNMVADGQFLYIRCKRDMCKYDLTDPDGNIIEVTGSYTPEEGEFDE